MAAIILAVVTGGAAVVSYAMQKKQQELAQQQHDDTMLAQENAAKDAKKYDLAAGEDIKNSETATTIYGGDRMKKKKLTANDLLVRPGTSYSESTLGF